MIANDDPRFSNELYDLFYSTKSVQVREKLIEYFTKQKDPCIEDYAVEILDAFKIFYPKINRFNCLNI